MGKLDYRIWEIRNKIGQHLWPPRQGKLLFLWRRLRHNWERVHVAPSDFSGHVSVWDLGRERRLVFGQWLDLSVESVIFTSGDWDELKREYWGQAMLPPVALPPNPSVLIFGLGGGTMVHLANQMLKPRQITIVELDPAVVAVAKEFMGLKEFANLRFLTTDALSAIQQLHQEQERFDFVLEDCFYEGMLDKTDDFVRQYIDSQAGLLSENGVLVFNRWFRTWTGETVNTDQARLEALLKERFAGVIRKPIVQRWLNELFFAYDLRPDAETVGAEQPVSANR